ncbi:MAG: acyltransferase family protein [Proteobacteria bacterium]|nr:acyltransferase family protein [Pseudomonadota bacterium]
MSRSLTAWRGYWGAARRYHRYSVQGWEHLPTDRAALIVGYHGRPIAYDLCMLTVSMYERLGYLPHGIIHQAALELPVMGRMNQSLGFVAGDGPSLGEAVARGEHILVQPGGTREGCRSARHRYEVNWGGRMGYLRLALQYGLPIVPVVSRGVDDGYIGLNDGYSLGKKLNAPGGLPVWFGVGPLGLWPLSPPFPVRITQFFGAPIEMDPGIDPSDRAALRPIHDRVTGTIQDLLDEANR